MVQALLYSVPMFNGGHMETTINGTAYEVKALETGENTKAAMVKNGWDGISYCLLGKRSACYLAFRNATTGEYSIAAKL